ncbi:MAG: thioredoxin [Clostridia bacterium]
MIELNAMNFEKEVKNIKGTVLIDFFATWCGPCRMLSPIIEEIDKEMKGTIKVCKCNVDENGELAAAFNVSSIPLLVVIRDGKIVQESMGYKDKSQVMKLLK